MRETRLEEILGLTAAVWIHLIGLAVWMGPFFGFLFSLDPFERPIYWGVKNILGIEVEKINIFSWMNVGILLTRWLLMSLGLLELSRVVSLTIIILGGIAEYGVGILRMIKKLQSPTTFVKYYGMIYGILQRNEMMLGIWVFNGMSFLMNLGVAVNYATLNLHELPFPTNVTFPMAAGVAGMMANFTIPLGAEFAIVGEELVRENKTKLLNAGGGGRKKMDQHSKWLLKTINSMRPMRVGAKAFGVTVFKMGRDTKREFYDAYVKNTVDAVLSF